MLMYSVKDCTYGKSRINYPVVRISYLAGFQAYRSATPSPNCVATRNMSRLMAYGLGVGRQGDAESRI
jgi:hypothetical protein